MTKHQRLMSMLGKPVEVQVLGGHRLGGTLSHVEHGEWCLTVPYGPNYVQESDIVVITERVSW